MARARLAANRSPSPAATIEPFIKMCQEWANVSESCTPASSASVRTYGGTDGAICLDAGHESFVAVTA